MALNNCKLMTLSQMSIGSNLDRVDPDAEERKAFERPLGQRVAEAALILLNTEQMELDPPELTCHN